MSKTTDEQVEMLVLAGRIFQFATYHPFAATWLAGAAMGAGATYVAMTSKSTPFKKSGIFTPRKYEVILTKADLNHMLIDPTFEIRLEAEEASVIVTSEKREVLKALPVVEGEEII